MDINYGEIWSRAAVNDDPGGFIEMFLTNDPEGDWTQEGNEPWASDISWGETSNYPGTYFKVRELGGGTLYSGYSPFSDVVYVEP